MVPLAWRMVTHDTGRFAITTLGVACSVALMLFLFSTVEGVRREANGYVAGRQVDVWLGQDSATNLFRVSSFLQMTLEPRIRQVPGVREVSPLLRLVKTTPLQGREVALFIFGFDPDSTLGWPQVIRGATRLSPGEIILDRAFAAKYRIGIGDGFRLGDHAFRVAALSRGSNALLIQFGFVTMEDAQAMLDLNRELVSFFLVTAQPGTDPSTLAANLIEEVPRLGAFTQEQFTLNNLEELRVGMLPILSSTAFSGTLLALAVLTLMLYGTVVDHREEYALLKAMGARQRFLVLLVLRQAALAVLFGFAAGLAIYLLGAPVLLRFVPEMAQSLTWLRAGTVLVTTLVMGLAGAWLPVVQLGRIYPAEVFRA